MSPAAPAVAALRLPRAGRVLGALLCGDLAILLGHLLLARFGVFPDLFDLDQEANLPTWYSSLKFVLAAVAAVACHQSEATVDGRSGTPRYRGAWMLVAALMLALSADETAQIHETLTDALMAGPAGANFRAAFGASEASDGMLWVIVLSPLLILAATALLLFYLTRFTAHRRLLGGGVAALALLAASALLETREAVIAGTEGYLSADRWRTYLWYAGGEEMAEQLAATLLVTVHLGYARLRWRAAGEPRPPVLPSR